ncbi:MAG: DUF4389 domain-containing protein [Candidatus Peregrinibacteria bacterium]|nr:DUF4389 domain-containing protein [Candidatus Peregrinibacteria bacterium]
MEQSPKKSSVSYSAGYSPTLSRLFIFRPFVMFVEIWVIYVWAFWMSLNMFVQFWIMLFLGERNESIWKRQLRFMRHIAKWQGYLMLLTDERPMWIED